MAVYKPTDDRRPMRVRIDPKVLDVRHRAHSIAADSFVVDNLTRTDDVRFPRDLCTGRIFRNVIRRAIFKSDRLTTIRRRRRQ